MSIGRIEMVDGAKKYVRYATLGGTSGVSGIQVGNVQDLTLQEGTENLTLKWKDPDNVVFNGETIAEWAGAKVIRKEGSSPESVMDGTLVVDSIVKDQYAIDGLQDSNVVTDTQYNYALFPYTAKNVYTMSDDNRISGEVLTYDPILQNNTWNQINKASKAGMAKEIWNIGDEKDGFQILDFDHDDLADGNGKAGITFLSGGQGSVIWAVLGSTSQICYYSNSSIYSLLAGTVFNNLSEELKSVIKTVKKPTATGDLTSITGVADLDVKLFLLSYKEITGSVLAANGSQDEGEKYEKALELIGSGTTWTRTVKQSPYKTYVALLQNKSWPNIARGASNPYRYAFCV